ncbi:hypothetical protein ILUMI_26456 [Ignelater luminosus]|uniref:Protein ABHD18 n=1 Tax=Ignelater luminosus TaxID=2038154 RepID=A0A8K0FXD6_IGNLU|nr:hypothetical protein ILUMI_26456 [Ignelater luminosus]
MSVSRLDRIYRSLLLSTFFTKGWGNPENILKLFEFRKEISNRERCVKLVSEDYPITIINQRTWNDCRILEGKFFSPLAIHLPDIVSPEVTEAYFQIIIPKKWKSKTYRPMCIHFAGTGDHYFWRRRNVMAKPLLKSGIAALLLENPFYGLRKPKDQYRSSLHNVSDIFVMGGCLILESLVLLRWCEKMGFGPLGVSGLSMGGHMASLAATNWPKPLVLVPCLSWSTASLVFTEGVMSDAINWDLLQHQYFSDSKFHDTLAKCCTIVDDPFEFCRVQDYSLECLSEMLTNKALTPYEVLNLIKTSGSKCAAYSSKEAAESKKALISSISNSRLMNLIKDQQFAFSKISRYSNMKRRDREAVWFMRGIMDECTHLKNFSVPFDTSLVIAICARSDGYVPREGCSKLEDLWPGSTVRYLDSGHVGAYIWHRQVFRDAIIEAFEKAKTICPPPSSASL